MAGINWDFIHSDDIEGSSTHKSGYVPSKDSGFTVGSVDLGRHNKEDIRTILQSYANKQDPANPRGYGDIDRSLLNKLSPYTIDGTNLGDSGGMAIEGRYGTLETRDLLAKTVKFTAPEIEKINKAKQYSVERGISAKFNTQDKNTGESNKDFQSLDGKTQTILASIAWQYGINRNKKTGQWVLKDFWDIKDDKKAIAKKLRSMGQGEYGSRREAEAKYIESK